MSSAAYRREDRVERVKSQLLSPRDVVDTALRIIQADGVDAVTIRRLAEELDVKSASLYYHFRDKDEILTAAARVAVQGIRGAGDPDRPWQEWLLENAIQYREALLEYPGLIPTLMRRHPLRIGTAEHEAAVKLMESQGCPVGAIMPLFDVLESLACGSVLYTTAVNQDNRSREWNSTFPALYEAERAAHMDSAESFRVAAEGVIESLSEHTPPKPPRRLRNR